MYTAGYDTPVLNQERLSPICHYNVTATRDKNKREFRGKIPLRTTLRSTMKTATIVVGIVVSIVSFIYVA